MTDMRAFLTVCCVTLALAACGASGGTTPVAPAPTATTKATPVAPAAGTLAPAKTPTPSGMPTDDPYGYGY